MYLIRQKDNLVVFQPHRPPPGALFFHVDDFLGGVYWRRVIEDGYRGFSPKYVSVRGKSYDWFPVINGPLWIHFDPKKGPVLWVLSDCKAKEGWSVLAPCYVNKNGDVILWSPDCVLEEGAPPSEAVLVTVESIQKPPKEVCRM